MARPGLEPGTPRFSVVRPSRLAADSSTIDFLAANAAIREVIARLLGMGARAVTDGFAPGTLLLAPPDSGESAADVLCVFDADVDEPGAVSAPSPTARRTGKSCRSVGDVTPQAAGSGGRGSKRMWCRVPA